jgi:hypothetical protein
MFLGLYENRSKTVLGEASSVTTYCIASSFFPDGLRREIIDKNVFKIA